MPQEGALQGTARAERVADPGSLILLLGQTCTSVGGKGRPRVDGSEA